MKDNKREFITYLDMMTALLVGEPTEMGEIIPLPLLLLKAEEHQTVSGKDYDDWVAHARTIIKCIKEIDRQMKQIGGYKGKSVLQIK